MKCQKCNKNEANVQYRESINGTTREICLCSECAKETGLLKRTDGIFQNMEREMLSAFAFPFGGASLFGRGLSRAFSNPFGSFPEIGGFFENDPVESIESITTEDDKKEAPKKGKKLDPREEIDQLKAKLLDAIADERYEEAAKLRDKIKKIKGE